MKRSVLIMAMLMSCVAASAQIQALFGYSTYYQAAASQPYIETYLLFDAWTLHFEPQADGRRQATVAISLVARQGDSICFAKKYDLNSPMLGTDDSLNFNLLDMQRFALTNGIYDLDVTLQDKNKEGQPVAFTEKLVINYDSKRPALSSVQLMSSVKPTTTQTILSRGGYDMEPYVDDFVPEKMSDLTFYYEVYNIDKEIGKEAFLAKSYIEVQETGTRVETLQHAVRKNASEVVPVLGRLDIHNLPSGNYNLVVELQNRDGNPMLIKRVPFFRSNPGVKTIQPSEMTLTFVGKYTDEEDLNLYLDALYPIASEQEKVAARQIVRSGTVEQKQAFLYEFWTRRDPISPEAAWLKYKERIDYVQEHFTYSITRGIMTDRGRVYLQYGPPDFVRDEKNFAVIGYSKSDVVSTGNHGIYNTESIENANVHAHYLPYQLWRYNRLEADDPNRVFLFWDEGSIGYYTLLQSNAKGEVQTFGWERMLSRQQLPEGVVGAVGQQYKRGY